MKERFHRGSDPWGRGSYNIPATAVMGSSDCGMSPDSPAPSDAVHDELVRFQDDLFRATGIKSKNDRVTQSGNAFMVKRWVTVRDSDFARAAAFAVQWSHDHNGDTAYIHEADIEELVDRHASMSQ